MREKRGNVFQPVLCHAVPDDGGVEGSGGGPRGSVRVYVWTGSPATRQTPSERCMPRRAAVQPDHVFPGQIRSDEFNRANSSATRGKCHPPLAAGASASVVPSASRERAAGRRMPHEWRTINRAGGLHDRKGGVHVRRQLAVKSSLTKR